MKGDRTVSDPRQPPALTDSQRAAAASILVAEYEFVEGLIPFYRQVELTALAGTGLVSSAVVAAVAAIETAGHPNHKAQAILLSASAWGPALLMLLEVVALTRIRRAATYIAKHVKPLANQLAAQTMLLEWETAPSSELVGVLGEAQPKGEGLWARIGQVAASKALIGIFLSSAPLIAMMWAVSVALATVGAALWPVTVFVGMPAATLGLFLGLYGIAVTRTHEGRIADGRNHGG